MKQCSKQWFKMEKVVNMMKLFPKIKRVHIQSA